MHKEAVVALIIKDGLILTISRRNNPNKFGLIGGKVDDGETTEEALFREVKEETSLEIQDTVLVYQRVEPRDDENGMDFYSRTFYVKNWTGDPKSSDEGQVVWRTLADLIGENSAFKEYNKDMINIFIKMFPEVYLVG